jgi:hypothetical protein
MFTTKAAAHYLSISAAYLEKLRVVGGGPEFLKFGKAVRYEQEALDRWISSRRRRTTSDVGQAA